MSRYLPHELQGESRLLDDVVKAIDEARADARAKDWAAAWQVARAAMASIQEYRAQAIRSATTDADRRGASPEARVYLNIYFSLPNYAYVTRGGPTVEPGQLRKEILEAEGLPVLQSIDSDEANR